MFSQAQRFPPLVAVVIVAEVPLITLLFRLNIFLQLARGVDEPEIVVITPEGFAVCVLQPNAIRSSFQIHQYAFSHILSLDIVHPFPGLTAIRMVPSGFSTQPTQLILSRRFDETTLLAQKQEVANSQLGVVSNLPAPTVVSPIPSKLDEPVQPAPVTAPSIFVCVGKADHAFLRRLQRQLADRQLSWHESAEYMGDPTQIRQTIDASSVIFVVMSPAELRDPNLRWQYGYALECDKPVIPLLIKGRRQDLPGELRHLQWIDCTRQTDPAAWRLDIVNALASHGIARTQGVFDSDLALAQALHQQLPQDCQGYRVVQDAYTDRHMVNMELLTKYGSMLIGLFSFGFIYSAFVLLFNVPNSDIMGNSTEVVFYIAGGICLGYVTAALMGRIHLIRQLTRGKIVPELFVMTPAGFAIHRFMIWPFPHMQSDAVTLRTISTLKLRNSPRRGLRILVRSTSGNRKTFTLRTEFFATDEIKDRLLRASRRAG